jgi:hypothetical protein
MSLLATPDFSTVVPPPGEFQVALNEDILGSNALVLARSSSTLSGSVMGSGCTSLRFKDGGADFSSAVPPYDGTFSPADPFDTTFKGRNANNVWKLRRGGTSPVVTVECWSVTLGVALFVP